MSPPLLQRPPSPTAAIVKDYAADRRARIWGRRYRRGLKVSYSIIALTDAVSFLTRVCGACEAWISAKYRSPPRSLPPQPMRTANY